MAGPNMARDQSLAGQSVKQGDYTVTYDANGYAKSARKDGGKSATSTKKTTHANDSATHQAMYEAAQSGDWDKVGSLSHGLIGANGDFSAGNQYMQELQDEFKYDDNEYYGKKYDAVYGQGAWDGGTGKPTYRSGSGASGGSTTELSQQGSVAPGYGEYGSFEDFMDGMGYDAYAEETRKAIQAAVQNAVNGYNHQIETTNEDTAELARQAYISKMMGEKNLDQQLAAGGYAGGMADSHRIAMQANYETNLNELEQQRLATVKELESAITNAQLTGDMQTAQELSNYLMQIQGQWNSYLQNQQAMQNQNYWNQQAMQNQNYWNQQSLNAENQNTARNWAMTLIQRGTMPDEQTLTAAGMTKAQAQTLMGTTGQTVQPTAAPRRVTNYDNGKLTTGQVKLLQENLGVTADGLWGSNSSNAANGMTADQAWRAYLATTATQRAARENASAGYGDVKSTVNQILQTSGQMPAYNALRDAYQQGLIGSGEYNILYNSIFYNQ